MSSTTLWGCLYSSLSVKKVQYKGATREMKQAKERQVAEMTDNE